MKKERNTTLSIIVPVYNEAENIDEFFRQTSDVLLKLDITYEFLFINDGSVDNTLEILVNLHYQDSKVKVINFSRNFGKEIATTAGLDYANGNAVIPMDVDLQDPPDVIPLLMDKWKEGYDVVNAKRIERKGDSWLKKRTAGLFYKIMRKFSDSPIPDNVGDFRLIDKKAVKALQELRETHRFMKGLFNWVGFKTIEVFYDRKPRFKGKTKWNYFKLINLAIEAITSFSIIPLKIATLFGLVVSISSFLYAVFAIGKKLLFGDPVQGYTSMIVIILFLGGLQLLTIGIIGEYIGRIYNETKKRPLYILSQTYGLKIKKNWQDR